MRFCGEDRVVVLVFSPCMYVRHGAIMHRDLKLDGQRRGSHQDDQADCSDSGVDGRMNNNKLRGNDDQRDQVDQPSYLF